MQWTKVQNSDGRSGMNGWDRNDVGPKKVASPKWGFRIFRHVVTSTANGRIDCFCTWQSARNSSLRKASRSRRNCQRKLRFGKLTIICENAKKIYIDVWVFWFSDPHLVLSQSRHKTCVCLENTSKKSLINPHVNSWTKNSNNYANSRATGIDELFTRWGARQPVNRKFPAV